MDVLTGAFHLVAVVIIVGGAAKVASPDAFGALLRSLRLPSGRTLSRLIGVAEVALGAVAIVVGGRIAAAAVALVYLAFTVVVVVARRSGATSCGCFGASDAPPSPVHVAVNLVSALVATATALAGEVPWVGAVLADQPLAGVPYLLCVAVGAWLAISLNTTGAVVFDRISDVAALGPTFRENATSPRPPARTGGTRA